MLGKKGNELNILYNFMTCQQDYNGGLVHKMVNALLHNSARSSSPFTALSEVSPIYVDSSGRISTGSTNEQKVKL